MYLYKNLDDTIAAIATPAGEGGIGIVRLSGKQAMSIADQVFAKKNGIKPSTLKSHTVHYGDVVDGENNEIFDEVLCTVMRAPRSYTKEDVVEISCHGGTASLKAILSLVIRKGARLAEPGEFTKRAFLNGRIDLTQAEAVLDIIQAKTEAFLKVSTHQLKGDLAAELEAIREQLMNVYITIEAFVNFPEDDVGDQGKEKLSNGLDHAVQRIQKLLDTSEQGRVLKDGVKIVLCGKPNAGKSSLLNVLLKAPRAIVSDIAGTTRDTIEEAAQIRGVPFQLVDTAGILEPRDLIEEEAVKRSRQSVAGADLVLFVFDASERLTDEDEQLMRAVNGQNVLAVLNKSDLSQQIDENTIKEKYGPNNTLKISALKIIGTDHLETAIVDNVLKNQAIEPQCLLVSNARHVHALANCLTALNKAKTILREGISLEFISEEVKAAVTFLDRITGKDIDADLLDNIFSQFCIGK